MKTLIAALGVLAIGTSTSLALDEPGRALLASDRLQIANDAILTGDPGGRIIRAFIPPYSGTVRVKWEFRSVEGSQVFSSAGTTLLSNCNEPTTSTSFVQKSCDLRVAAGVPIVIDAASSGIPSLRKVRLYYKVVDFDGAAIIYELAGP